MVPHSLENCTTRKGDGVRFPGAPPFYALALAQAGRGTMSQMPNWSRRMSAKHLLKGSSPFWLSKFDSVLPSVATPKGKLVSRYTAPRSAYRTPPSIKVYWPLV